MKILIVRVGAMGDVLHALPAVAALRIACPDWQIDWVVDPRWAPLLANAEGDGPIVNRIHLAETKLWSKSPASFATLRSIFNLRKALRNEHYDLVVDMQGTLRSAVIAWMAGPQQLVGYRDPRESMATIFYKKRMRRHGNHVVEQGAALLGEACELTLTPALVDLSQEEWADNWAADLIGKQQTCVLAAGGGWGAKRWPAKKYGELAKHLQAMGLDVVVNATRKNDPLAEEVVLASEGAARFVVCNVAGLIALARRAALLVGGDSGPTHLAAALNVPLVALFGPTDPARNGPWGPGPKAVLRNVASVNSYRHAAEIDTGLANISVVEVVEAVRGLI